jgi:hypothetical protein
MMDVFAAIERSTLSVWVREDLWAFPALLILHAIGMAFLAGGGVAVALRVLGVARAAPMRLFARFFPAMWAGFALALVSGVLLLIAYPAKALTNWVFGLKFVLLVAATLLVREMARRVFPAATEGTAIPADARLLAVASLLCWAAAIFAGRFLAYTHQMLLVS